MGLLGRKHNEGNKWLTRMPLKDDFDKLCHIMVLSLA